MNYTPGEIDKLFISHEQHSLDLPALKTYHQSLSSFKPHLDTQLNDLKSIHNHLQMNLYTLNRLSDELNKIERMNNEYEKESNNMNSYIKLMGELMDLLDIDEKYFSYFENEKYEDEMVIGRIMEAFYVFGNVCGKGFFCKDEIDSDNREKDRKLTLKSFNIKATKYLIQRIDNTISQFRKSFTSFLYKRLNSYNTKSRGELTIHKEIYDDLSKYLPIITDEYIYMYVKSAKKLYTKEFKYHLDSVYDVLCKNKAKNIKLCLDVIFISLLLIRECECDFVWRMFGKG